MITTSTRAKSASRKTKKSALSAAAITGSKVYSTIIKPHPLFSNFNLANYLDL